MTAGAVVPHPPSNCTAENPWPGLTSYAENDADFFQGRDADIEELYRLVDRGRLTILLGRTGLGKTSLLRAGLVPRLRRAAALPVYIRLDFKTEPLDLASQTLVAVRAAADAAGVESPESSEGMTLWEYFHRMHRDFWSSEGEMVTPILVFDQFEETFTLGHQDDVRRRATKRFLEQLADLVEGRVPISLKEALDRNPESAAAYAFGRHVYKVVLSMREDYLPHLENLRRQMPSVVSSRYRIVEMNGDDAMKVVSRPDLVEDDAAKMIVRIAAGRDREASQEDAPLQDMQVNPMLLSVLCSELNQKRDKTEEKKIGVSLINRAAEVLQDFYDRKMRDIPFRVRDFVERHLVLPGGQRDSIAWTKINKAFEPDLLRLVREGIVVREFRNDVERIELAHDELAKIIHERKRAGVGQAAELLVPDVVQRTPPWVSWWAVSAVLAAVVAGYALGNTMERRHAARIESGLEQRILIVEKEKRRVEGERETLRTKWTEAKNDAARCPKPPQPPSIQILERP